MLPAAPSTSVEAARLAQPAARHEWLRAAQRAVRFRLWQYPTLFLALFGWRYPRQYRRTKNNFWLGGFNRCGNTFAGVLLEQAVFGPDIDYHVHHPTVIARHLRTGRPGVLVVRNPRDCGISWAIYSGKPLRAALEDYQDFLRYFESRLGELIVFDFAWFTAHPEELVRAVSRHFGVTPVAAVSPELLQAVNRQIESGWRDASGRLAEHQVARPSPMRATLKEGLLAELAQDPGTQAVLVEVTALYQRFAYRAVDVKDELMAKRPSAACPT